MSKKLYAVGALAAIILLIPAAAGADVLSPSITINPSGSSDTSNAEVFTGLKLALLLSALTFLPSLLMSVTCFARFVIVLSLTRQALGTAQTPPNQLLIGLALFLTFAVMSPVFSSMYNDSLLPYSEDQIGHKEAYDKAWSPLRDFMLRHTREQDLELFMEIGKMEPPEAPENLSPVAVVPAFLLSELNSAFQIAFLIYLPFLVLDMIVSSVLTSMSMITLPPTVISLPIKLMLFVVIDGWHLIIGNLVQSYH
ncbi:MAG: flagellar type III secretion system pore protein FliP [Bdellovibrionales bacterium]|nr:flagellar type III secretion system pore protein FliP [Bdellovibrionales bacterium]